MNPRYQKTHELLARWGAALRQNPKHNDSIKSCVLEQARAPQSSAPTQRPFMRVPKFALAFAVLVLIALALPSAQKKSALISSPAVSGPQPLSMLGGSDLTMGTPQNLGTSRQVFPIKDRIFPYRQPEAPATDTRELLKTDYSAAIRTRNVQELGKRIQTTVRGFEGRVDRASLSQDTGHISFVIPAARLDAFRNELVSWAGARFITEQTHAQNLLPEKRVLESEEERIKTEIAALQTERADLVASYQRTKAWLEREVARVNQELKTASEPERPTLEAERARLQARLARERNAFESKRRALDEQIKNQQAALERVQKQDTELVESVATVQGSVSLLRINPIQWAAAYLNGYWVAAGLAALAIISYLWSLRRPVLWP